MNVLALDNKYKWNFFCKKTGTNRLFKQDILREKNKQNVLGLK